MLEVKGSDPGLTIGAVARATGVAPSTIRYYEAAGILPRPARKNGIRRFSPAVVDQLKVIRFCRAAGMPVRRLTWMADEKSGSTAKRDAWSKVVRDRVADLESAMRDARRLRRLLLEAEACRCHENDEDDCVVLRQRM